MTFEELRLVAGERMQPSLPGCFSIKPSLKVVDKRNGRKAYLTSANEETGKVHTKGSYSWRSLSDFRRYDS